jgi:hypothetical protein
VKKKSGMQEPLNSLLPLTTPVRIDFTDPATFPVKPKAKAAQISTGKTPAVVPGMFFIPLFMI